MNAQPKSNRESFGPAVTDGRLNYTSVSAITKFDPSQYGGCERRWWYRYVQGLPEPQTFAQKHGVDVHAQIEHFLKTGEDVLGDIARSGRVYIPNPDDVRLGRIYVEQHFNRDLYAADIPLVGYIDLVNATGYSVSEAGEVVEDDAVELCDWKSTSTLSYVKPGYTLAQTVQMIGYAEWARKNLGGPRYRLSHVYFQTQGKRQAQKITTVLSADAVAERWAGVEETVGRMKNIAKVKDKNDVAPNWSACAAYKGCPHRQLCPRSPAQILTDTFGGQQQTGDKPMNILDRVKQRASTQANGAPSAALATPTTPQPAPAAKSASDALAARKAAVAAEMARLVAEEQAAKAAQQAAQAAQEPRQAPPTSPSSETPRPAQATPPGAAQSVARGYCAGCGVAMTADNSSRRLSTGTWLHIGCPSAPAAVLPPDAPASDPALAAVPHVDVQAPAVATPVQATPDAAPRKRGRPRKDASVLATASGADATPATHFASSGLHLYVDAVPELVDALAVGIKSLDGYIAELCQALADEYQAADIRCAPQDSALGFGKWKGALAAVTRAQPPEDGVYTLLGTRESELRQVVVEALRPLCATYVHGV